MLSPARSAWCTKKLNSTGTLIQTTTTEAPQGHMYYIGLDVHKKTISYCVKDTSGQVHQEGKVGATRWELDDWISYATGLLLYQETRKNPTLTAGASMPSHGTAENKLHLNSSGAWSGVGGLKAARPLASRFAASYSGGTQGSPRHWSRLGCAVAG